MVRVALLQMTSGIAPDENLVTTLDMIDQAAANGANFIATPEVTNCLSPSRSHQKKVLAQQEKDLTLVAIRQAAARHRVWILIGSLALLPDGDQDARFHNRSFLIDPSGNIAAQYDKIHMFDVTLSETESYRESDAYCPGANAVVAKTDFGTVGLAVCYDVRFPHLFRRLAKAGAQILTVPAAFAKTTGQAHWEILLRARAIETGCFVVAPAQCGTHYVSNDRPRETFGHSMVVSPWGEILAMAGDDPVITYADLDLADVDKTRQRVPSVIADQQFDGP